MRIKNRRKGKKSGQPAYSPVGQGILQGDLERNPDTDHDRPRFRLHHDQRDLRAVRAPLRPRRPPDQPSLGLAHAPLFLNELPSHPAGAVRLARRDLRPDHRHWLLPRWFRALAAVFLRRPTRRLPGTAVVHRDNGGGAVCVWVWKDLLCERMEGVEELQAWFCRWAADGFGWRRGGRVGDGVGQGVLDAG